MRLVPIVWLWLASVLLVGVVAPAQAQTRKPNIVVLWGDDVGYWNVSAYNQQGTTGQ